MTTTTFTFPKGDLNAHNDALCDTHKDMDKYDVLCLKCCEGLHNKAENMRKEDTVEVERYEKDGKVSMWMKGRGPPGL